MASFEVTTEASHGLRILQSADRFAAHLTSQLRLGMRKSDFLRRWRRSRRPRQVRLGSFVAGMISRVYACEVCNGYMFAAHSLCNGLMSDAHPQTIQNGLELDCRHCNSQPGSLHTGSLGYKLKSCAILADFPDTATAYRFLF